MDEDQDEQFVNNFSGTAGYVAGAVYRGTGVAFFLALFVLSAPTRVS